MPLSDKSVHKLLSARLIVAVNPSDVDPLPDGPCDAIYVGTQGDVHFIDESGHEDVAVGVIGREAFRLRQILASDTTADNILVLYN